MQDTMLDSPVTAVKGVTPKRAALLQALGIETQGGLLEHLPREYRDFSVLTKAAELMPGVEAACALRVCAEPRLSFVRKGMSVVKVRAGDETGVVSLIWYNQPYRKNALSVGKRIVAVGKVEEGPGCAQMICPALETVDEKEEPRVPGILPVYPLTAGLSQPVLRTLMRSALNAALPAKEFLSAEFRGRYGLCERNYALENVHFPLTMADAQQAKRRVSTDALLAFLLAMRILGASRQTKKSRSLKVDQSAKAAFLAKLPFTPTGAQRRAIDEIADDLGKDVPMSRLLQGDVGSGKTAVAFFAMYAAMRNNTQAVMMAPTEVLARQHAKNAAAVLGEQNVCLLTGSMSAAERQKALESIASGSAGAVIGTHALIQEQVLFKDLGVVVTDEQHRFGVTQRSKLSAKGNEPHALIMSATPIPRTLALILFGDLDVTTLDERPPGRQSVATHIVGAHKREAMYGFVREQVEKGRQAYIVSPVIDAEDGEEFISVEALFGELSAKWLRGLRLKRLHGRVSAREKDEIMRSFAAGDVDVLFSTTVIEVGVDVPNASVMVIEGAERFGLAQMHQLRGRVGRGQEASFCFLRYDGNNAQTRARLKLLTETDDGFKIAEKDLQIRGPGAFLGTRQHGMTDGALKNIDDLALLLEVQKMAEDISTRQSSGEFEALCAWVKAKYGALWDTWTNT